MSKPEPIEPDRGRDTLDTETDPADLPFDPRTGFHGYEVTIRYKSHYARGAEPTRDVTGETWPAESSAGETVAIYDEREARRGDRILVLTSIGTVYSLTGDGPNQRTLVGSCGEVVEIADAE